MAYLRPPAFQQEFRSWIKTVEDGPGGYYTGMKMERFRLTPPGRNTGRGERARLYVRWMPHLGAEAVALYELLRVLPTIGNDEVDAAELAELLRSTPPAVEEAVRVLSEAGFVAEREGWLEVAEHPPAIRAGISQAERPASGYAREPGSEGSRPEEPVREIEIVRAGPEGISPDDYFRYMGTLPAPHIIEFLNSYTERDGVEAEVIREALRIASERDARRVGYVRSILERWVERGVKNLKDVELFEKDRSLRLVRESGAVKGGALALKSGGGVKGGAHRQPAAGREEDYRWFFGE